MVKTSISNYIETLTFTFSTITILLLRTSKKWMPKMGTLEIEYHKTFLIEIQRVLYYKSRVYQTVFLSDSPVVIREIFKYPQNFKVNPLINSLIFS